LFYSKAARQQILYGNFVLYCKEINADNVLVKGRYFQSFAWIKVIRYRVVVYLGNPRVYNWVSRRAEKE